MNGQAFTALKSATNALKNVHKELDVENVQDIMDELAEQHDLSNEIANAISSPVGKISQTRLSTARTNSSKRNTKCNRSCEPF